MGFDADAFPSISQLRTLSGNWRAHSELIGPTSKLINAFGALNHKQNLQIKHADFVRFHTNHRKPYSPKFFFLFFRSLQFALAIFKRALVLETRTPCFAQCVFFFVCSFICYYLNCWSTRDSVARTANKHRPENQDHQTNLINTFVALDLSKQSLSMPMRPFFFF